jgi:hypothetical protein
MNRPLVRPRALAVSVGLLLGPAAGLIAHNLAALAGDGRPISVTETPRENTALDVIVCGGRWLGH